MSKVWQPNETYNSKARAAMEKVLGLLNIGLRVARVVNGLKIEYQQTQLLTKRLRWTGQSRAVFERQHLTGSFYL